MNLSIRAFAAFLACPGLVAGLGPWLIARHATRVEVWQPGFALLLLGVGGLIWCVRDFYVSGRGTLAPWDPPRHLVVVGLYRCVRNPMYLSVLTVIAGWALYFGSWWLAGYGCALAAAFHLRVLRYEEPSLARQFGDGWNRYVNSVPRWVPAFPR